MTPEDLKKAAAAEQEAQAAVPQRIKVCMAAGCMSCHSDKVKASLETAVKDGNLGGSCKVMGVGCLGLCAQGPLVAVEPGNVLYKDVAPQDAQEIVASLSGASEAQRRRSTESTRTGSRITSRGTVTTGS